LCTLYDASYIAPIELCGDEHVIVQLLHRMSAPSTSSSSHSPLLNLMYRNGGREGSLLLHQPDCYPRSLIGPVTFHWQPTEALPESLAASAGHRRLWIWVHAAIHDQLLTLLTEQMNVNTSGPSSSYSTSVTVASLRDAVLRFELNGPKCHAVLAMALRPLTSDTTPESKDGSSSSTGVRDGNEVPSTSYLWGCLTVDAVDIGMASHSSYSSCRFITSSCHYCYGTFN
jgi:hypothetical protein